MSGIPVFQTHAADPIISGGFEDQSMSEKHTPTPWWVEDIRLSVVSRAIRWSAEIPTAVAYVPDFVTSPEAHEAMANAAFIVRACNAHEQLVEACTTLSRAFPVGERLENMTGRDFRKFVEEGHGVIAAIGLALNQARDALAIARAEE